MCGGGSQELYSVLNNLLKNDNPDIEIVDNPRMANAIGYYKIGQYQVQIEEWEKVE
ncbi:MAG: hypothetical protein ACOCV1_08050 [Bacillota bacterium]